jgi:hypothetical protein
MTRRRATRRRLVLAHRKRDSLAIQVPFHHAGIHNIACFTKALGSFTKRSAGCDT